MSDEQQARDLLLRVTRLPDEIAPPVQKLIRAGRRRRKLRSAQRTVAVGVVAVLATVTPLVIRAINASPHKHRPSPPITGRPTLVPGPSAAQLAKFRWSALPSSPLGPRQQPLLALTGRYVVELGGSRNGHPANDGAAFDLKTRRWQRIPAVASDVGFEQAVTAWTGRELFVTDGVSETCKSASVPPEACEPHAGLYNPVTNRWSVTPLPRAMIGLDPVAVTWTGRVIVLGAVDSHNLRMSIAAYNPATGRWQVITPRLPARHQPQLVQVVATYNRVILWSEWIHPLPRRNDSGIDVFAFTDTGANPVGRWRNVTGKWPQLYEVETPVFTGSSILLPPSRIWCSICFTVFQEIKPYFADPVTLRRTATIPYERGVELFSNFIWAGQSIISINNGRGNPLPFKLTTLSDYDPATRTWQRLPTVPKGLYTTSQPVWTGTELVVVNDTGTVLALHR